MKALLGVSEREVHLWENALHLSEEYRQRGNLEIASGGGNNTERSRRYQFHH